MLQNSEEGRGEKGLNNNLKIRREKDRENLLLPNNIWEETDDACWEEKQPEGTSRHAFI